MPTMQELRCYLEQRKLEHIKSQKRNLAINASYTPNAHEILFHNMEVIDLAEGHRMKCIKTIQNPCYKDVIFQLSDNLSAYTFSKKLEHIREKIYVKDLEIISLEGNMVFRMKNEVLPIVSYKTMKLKDNELPLGINLENDLMKINLTTDPNMIIAGVPGCGKSTLLNMMICHILENNLGSLYLVDLKAGIEFGVYENCKAVKSYSEEVEDSHATIVAFKREMNKRFKLLKEKGVKRYEDYIEKFEYMPRYFLIIDEFADLMPTKKIKDGEFDVCRELTDLGRKARATGGHLILATQRPNRDSLPPNLKAVCSCVVGFRMANVVNSKIVIDEGGLEDLENREYITVVGGRKLNGRTMYLDPIIFEKIVTKNTVKNKSKGVEKHTEPEEQQQEASWV